jgi:hypothetical protein
MLADESAATQCSFADTKPDYGGPYAVTPLLMPVRVRRLADAAFAANASKPLSVRAYLEEAFFFVPLQLALGLQRARNFEAALGWFRLVYDYSQPLGAREITPILREGGFDQPSYFRNLESWLADPLDPHAIARTRPGTYRRAVLIFIVRCLLEYADAEFTQDTSESITRARILYETALELLALPELHQHMPGCLDLVAQIPAAAGDAALSLLSDSLARQITRLRRPATIRFAVDRVLASLAGPEPVESRAHSAELAVIAAFSSAEQPRTLGTMLADAPLRMSERQDRLLRDDRVVRAVTALETAMPAVDRQREDASVRVRRSAATAVQRSFVSNRFGFCVGPNPIIEALRIHADVNLLKIRSCRNITGIRRTVDPYSAPTDQISGLPTLSADGRLVFPQTAFAQPTPFRYSVLIQRAKELTGYAQQLESLMLSALEKRDSEALTLLRSRQDVQVARASIRVQQLRVSQAEDRVTLAGLQQERADIEGNHYQQLLDVGELQLEREAMGWLETAAAYNYSAAALSAWAAADYAGAAVWYGINWRFEEAHMAGASAKSSAAGAASSLAQAASTWSQIQQMRANIERTRQEWGLRVQLARQDQRIAAQQARIETEQVRISEQDLEVSELQADNAEQLLEFHDKKFTNLDLYDWMAGILEREYGRLLQQAAGMAQLAARQIAFERQEGSPPSILADYWDAPADSSLAGVESTVDRRGLTGSARLLRDIAELDQWAFETTRRKAQPSKTFSLAQFFPLDFERLRTDGLMTFATPLPFFDAELPGHYLRLIKRVSVTVVALVPPVQGIRATLSNTGASRVVTGPDVFQTVTIRRPPESIALSSPVNATGVFTFEPQPELTNPFESQGVDTVWEFRMPRAGNQFDFGTLADVLVTIDYTAIDSPDYYSQVVRQLERRLIGDRAFSLRRDFPDAWWDLHNPEQTDTPLVISFESARGDFPPNADGLLIEQVALLVVSRVAIPADAVPVRLTFVETSTTAKLGGSAMPVDRLVSTRRANGGPWRPMLGKSPIGRWELSLTDSDETREWLAGDSVVDLLLVVTYAGETPAWPG